MLKVKNEDIKVNGHWFEYELEDGTLLHQSEWNGEVYTVKKDGVEISYHPIYAEEKNCNGGYDIIGFKAL